MKTPTIWRRKVAGAFIGSWHVTIKGKRINLGTQDADEARRRRARAMRGQTRFKDDNQGAADAVIAALDATPPQQTAGVVDGAARTDGTVHPETGAPPPLALPPMQQAEGPLPPEEQASGGSWVDDVAGSGGANGPAQPDASPAAADGAERVRIKDLPILEGAFITLSRLLVQVQIAGQVAAARKFGGLDLPALRDPPPKDIGEFLLQQGQPWPNTDPREPGRQIWEGFLRRICPEDLPIPDWALAPLVVAACTLPVQLANAKRAQPPEATPTEQQQPEAPPAGAAA